ncbi:MAG: PRD domain-containing protein [Coprococcus sp.]
MDCLRGMNHTKVLTLTENSYVGLVIHISIAINRILKGEVIESNAKWQEELSKDEDYRLAEEIVEELEEEFEIQIPDVEISYICLHIKGSKHEKVALEGTEVLDLENREVQQLLNQMIDAFDEKAGVSSETG